ncbi:MAG: hemolysin family protein [Saprospiraceae bacterium]|jgi:CBS domain containing-hemolysin-like protein|nr:HlyC/CorC family transporter [Saprospiraceae bacterium]
MATDILITITLVLLNGFFVAAEFAIVKVRASQIKMKADEGYKSAILSTHILNHLDGYLAATQLGITLASLGLGWVGEPVVSKILIQLVAITGLELSDTLAHKIALPIAFFIITVLHIVFGELAPKSIAIQKPETTTLLIAYPLNLFYFVFRPFIWVLNGFANFILKLLGIYGVHGAEIHSSDELKYLIKQSKEGGNIINTDYEIIRNAFDFADMNVKQIMVPRNKVVAINVDTFNKNILDKLLDEGYSRIPCYEKNIDNIIGLIYLKDLLRILNKKSDYNIKHIVRPLLVTSESRKIGSLLKEFQKKHIQMAMVVDEFGGLDGIVTIEDIIEELVGEIQDEYDNEVPLVKKISDKIYQVIATGSIDDINDHLPYSIEKVGDASTLAGVLIYKFGRIPNPNDIIKIEEYEITIIKRIRNTIYLVQLRDITQ